MPYSSLLYDGVPFLSAWLTFQLSLLFHHPDMCLVSCGFLTLIFVGLFALISAYVFYADSQHPVLIATLSSSGRDPRTRPNPLHVLTPATPVARTSKLLVDGLFSATWQAVTGIHGFSLSELRVFSRFSCSNLLP